MDVPEQGTAVSMSARPLGTRAQSPCANEQALGPPCPSPTLRGPRVGTRVSCPENAAIG